MDSSLCNALLTGRPYGGLAIMYRKQLAKEVKIISTGERMIAVTIGTLLLINVYFPNTSRTDYKDVCLDILSDIDSVHAMPSLSLLAVTSIATLTLLIGRLKLYVNLCLTTTLFCVMKLMMKAN